MTRRLQLLFLFVFMLGLTPAFSQRTIGYLPSYRDPNDPNIKYSCLTDVVFSFINFNTDGTLITNNPGDAVFGFDSGRFSTVKGYCKPIAASGPNLWISVGGADDANARAARFSSVCQNTGFRATLVTALVNFAVSNNLYGIDVDWEFPANTNAERNAHQALMEDLKAKIAAVSPSLKLSFTVGGETNAAISNPKHTDFCNPATLAAADYINVMAYDLPQSYANNHSDVTRCQEAVSAWKAFGGAGAPWGKMSMAAPLYGRQSPRGSGSNYQLYSAEPDYVNVYNSSTGLSSGGFYYNSKSQIIAKIDWLATQGGSGIIMWDVGQDRAAPYNLQQVACAEWAIACAAPTPDLGADKGICNPGSVTLASGVASQSGRTFSWTKDGSTISGATSASYSATQAGVYEITVSQGTCSRKDAVTVVATDAVLATGSSHCGPGPVVLTVNSSGSTYEWYDQLNNGTLLATGQTYTPSPSTTTTYYVQQATGATTYYTGKPSINAPAAQSEFAAQGTLPVFTNKIVVSQSLKIQSVNIYLGAAGYAATPAYPNAKLMAISAVDGLAVSYQSAAVTLPASAPSTSFTFPANLDLPPGTYYIGIYVPGTAATSAIWIDPGGVATHYTQAGVFDIDGKAYKNYGGGFALTGSQGTNYGQLFNWQIVTGVVNPCPRKDVIATINTPPATPTGFTGSLTPCAGSTGNVYSVTNVAGLTYAWTYSGTGQTITNGAGTSSITVTYSAGATNGVWTVTPSLNSCPATTPYNSGTVTISSATAPSVAVTANPGTTICAGTSVTFTATPTNGGTTPTYQWKLNGTNVTGSGATYTNAALASGNQVTVQMTSSSACASPTTATSTALTMTVNAAATPSVTVSANPGTTICAGTSVTFTPTPVNGGAAPTYQWKLNGTNVSTGATYTNASLANNDQVTVQMTSNAACVSPATATSTALVMVVNAAVTPSVTVAANPGTTICAGTSVTFTPTPVNGGAAPTYQWKLNGTNVATGATYTNASLANGNQVTVQMTSNAACASPATSTSTALTMVVNAAVTPSVTVAANPGTTICPGTSVTFTPTPTNGGATPAYQWKLNGTNVSTGATYTNAALVNGDQVTVQLTSNAACASPTTATSTALAITTTAAVTPSVTVSANPGTTICPGTSVTFTPTPTNGGATPAYQWKLNGTNVSTGATYTNAGLVNGDQVTVQLTSNAACVSPTTATSTALTITTTATVTPSVTVSANPGTTICPGTSVTFTPTPVNGGTTPTYQWKLNGTNVATGATYTNASLANGNQVTVQMTSNAACVSPATATSTALTITTTSTVAPSVTVSANPGTTICPGTSVTFTPTPTNGGATPAYQWKLNGTNVSTGATYTNAALVNGDQVTVQLTSNAACVSPATATSTALTITTTATVTPSVTVSANPGTTICAGTSVTFTPTPTNGGATPAYQWKLNGTNVSTGATYTNASLANNDQVTVQLTSNASCVSPATASSTALTMVVNPAVTPSVTVSANPGTTICAGTSVTFTPTPTNGGAAPTYQWKLNGTNVSTGATYTNASLANGNQVTVQMTSNAACASPATATSTALTMVVNPAVTPSVTVSANPGTTICPGTSVTFTPTPTNGGATPAYQWKLNGTNVSTGATYTNAALVNGDQVTVQLTSNAACASPATATSTALAITTTATVAPSVTVSANPGTTICPGTSVTFTPTPTNGGATPAYQWKLNGTNVSTGATYTNAALVNGDQVTVQLTSSVACASPTTATSTALTITTTSAVTPSVTVSANPGTTICAGTSVTFTPTPTNGGATPAYQWKLNGTNVATGATYTNAALVNGDQVTVQLTSNAACASPTTVTSTALTITTTSAVTPSVTVSANPGTTICAGTSVTFTPTPVNGGTTPTYQWKLNGTNVATGATYTNASLANGNQVTVQMTSNAACASPATATSTALTMVVNPAVTPSVTVSANPGTTICPGTSVTFTPTPTNGGAAPTYQWKLNGTNVSTGATYTNAALVNGDQVTVQLTSNAACASPATATSTALAITTTATVTPSVTVSANPGTTICPGTSVTFTPTPTNGGATPAYQWKLNGTNVSTGATYTNAALVNGDQVTVQLTSSVACASPTTATSTALTITTTSAVTPSVTVSANPGTTICAGTSVTFTPTPTNGGATPAYQWKLNGTNVSTGATYTNAALVNGDQVTVQLTSNAACASPTTATSTALAITTTATVTPSVTVSANPGTTICPGTSVTFTPTPTNGGATPAYQWKLNGTNVSTGATYTNAALVNGDQLTVQLTSNAACASPTTATSTALAITTTATVTPSVTVSANPGTTICPGTSVTFTPTPTNGGAAPTYQWKLNGTNVATGVTYTNAALVNGDQVTVQLTSSVACASPTTATSTALTITTTSAVTPSVTVSANPGTTICPGTLVTFTPTPVNGGATPAYQWKLNGTVVGSGATYSNAGLVNGDQVTVQLTSSSACASPATATSSASTITLNSAPSSPSPIVGTFTVMQGQSGIGYSVTNVAGMTYNWSYTGTGYTITGSGSSITIDYSLTATSGVLSVTAMNGCGTSTATTQSITVTPVGTPQPDAFTASTSTVCQGVSGVVYTVPNVVGTAYSWTYSGTGYTFNGIGSSITIDFSMTATSGTLSVVANNGTGNSLPRSMPITVNAMASQPGSISGSPTATQGQTNVAYFVPSQPGVTFDWSYNGTGVTFVTGQGTNGVTVNYSSTATSGDIEVRASSTLCPSTSLPTPLTVTVSASTAIEDGLDLAAYGLKVYPNPAASNVTVEINVKNVGSKLNLALYDVLGNEVRVLLDDASVISDSYNFSLEGLAYGIYFVRAKSGDDMKMIKLIKY